MTRDELAKHIYDVAHITGEFTLRSGIVSNEYFDKYQFESDPTLLVAIAEKMSEFIPEGTEMLAGLEMGGISIAAALSIKTGIPCVFVRKSAKEYGTCKLAEGPSVQGKQVLVVEDVVTSGGQILLSAADLRALGATITHCVCVIDREQGGREKLRADGIELLSLFSMTELKAHA